MTAPLPLAEALAQWEATLDARRDDPALIAGCARLGRLLGGAR